MKKVVFWSFVVSLAGFLFGFDTVVISGAEQTIQSLWGLSKELHGLATSMALWGTVLGALVGGWPSERLGRKKTLLIIGILYAISALGSALAPEVYSFMVARFIGGLAIGASTIAAPLFISEISPSNRRGMLTGFFQFGIVFGILIAFLSNSLLSGTGPNDWRWMLGVETFPAILYVLLLLPLPESPRWLIIRKNQSDKALTIFRNINPKMSEEELDGLVNEVKSSAIQSKSTGFFSRRLLLPILLAILIAFFNQLSGINAVLYYAPRIFELTGLGEKAALIQSVGIGATNLVFTFLGLWLIDRAGRKTLLYIGSAGYILSLGACALAFHLEYFTIVPYCIFLFIASHAVGQGAVIWVFIGEIFPNRYRAAGQTLGCFTHWLFAALITLVFPSVVELFQAGAIFTFFCFMMVLQLIWVIFMMPETKGTKLEETVRN